MKYVVCKLTTFDRAFDICWCTYLHAIWSVHFLIPGRGFAAIWNSRCCFWFRGRSVKRWTLFLFILYSSTYFNPSCFCRDITSGTINDTGSVAANSTTAIEVVSEVAYDFMINLMRDIGSDWDIDYDFDVGVKVKLPIVHSFTIPLHKKGCLKLPTLSDIF